MITYNTVEEIYHRNCGSMNLYKRSYCNSLNYTDGIMDFQTKLNANWFVDLVVSYIPKVLEEYKQTEDYFFVVEIALNKKQEGYFEIYHEAWIDGNYHEHVPVAKQNISFIDLPTKDDDEITSYKFFLELSSANPTVFTLLLPLEH